MNISPHFTLAELTGSSAAKREGIPNVPHREHLALLVRLAFEVLEPWRAAVGPIRITSGFRSAAVNTLVGGSSTSDHLDGSAADCKPLEVTQDQAWSELLRLIREGLPVRQAILYPGAHIHVAYGTDQSAGGQLLVKVPGGYRPWVAPNPTPIQSTKQETVMPESIKVEPLAGLLALLQGIQDRELSREEFILAADLAVETGAFEPVEEAAWGAVYDIVQPLVGKLSIPKLELFARRTPSELRADAAAAGASGKTKRAARLHKVADRREARLADKAS